MAVTKAHHEFHKIDLNAPGWQLPEGYAPDSGALELIISGSLDTENKKGSRTRILRFPPGLATYQAIVHDYWEEVFMLEGDMTVGADENGNGGESFEGGDRLRARAERRLVGGELVQLHASGRGGFAGNVSLDIEDAGTRDGTGRHDD